MSKHTIHPLSLSAIQEAYLEESAWHNHWCICDHVTVCALFTGLLLSNLDMSRKKKDLNKEHRYCVRPKTSHSKLGVL